MKIKAVSGIMLKLLLLGMLTLAFKIEIVSAMVPEYPAIYVDPPIVENIMPGNNVTVSIKTDYTGCDIWGYEFTLVYNADILNGVEVTNGDLIPEPPPGKFILGTFNNTEGTLSWTAAFLFVVGGPIPSVSGPGTLAYVTFTVVGYGTSNITLTHARLVGWNHGILEPQLYNIIDSETMPDHIGHGLFSNKFLGDVDSDGDVDGFDLTRMCGAYGFTPDDPNWDKPCDINLDGIIDGFDLTPACGNYGKTL